MVKYFLFTLLLLSGYSTSTWSQYYDTLPKGVRLITTKHITSSVSSSYNQSQAESPYQYKIETDIKTLEKIEDETVQEVLELFKPYPEAYNKLSLGTHKMEAKADVKVNVYAFAYGITDRVSAYVGVPIYDARVNINYTKEKSSSEKEVSEALLENYGDNWAQTLGHVVDQVYAIDGGTIQSGITNALGYQELGDWKGQGLGDTEFGILYNFLRTEDYGLMLTVGGVAPTGYVDDPDLLQDIGFGDGQWDVFAEIGGGFSFNQDISFGLWTRYIYQTPSNKTLRAPFSKDITVSDKKSKFYEKLGNKINIGANLEFYTTDWLKFIPSVLYTKTEKAKYSSNDPIADELLALNTDSSSQSIRVSSQITTVRLFQQKKFIAPGHIGISVQKMVEGQNTPKVDIMEIDFRMYF